jgi:hypothetical protein
MVEDMCLDLEKMTDLWNCADGLEEYITHFVQVLSSGLSSSIQNPLEDGAKAQPKIAKSLHKNVRWCNAYQAVDKLCKDFIATIPLISMLGAK